MISITGSTEAGARIAELGAPSIKRICQELGGKSANVILEGADLAKAVPAGITGMMLNCGQTCTALTRMIVDEKSLVSWTAVGTLFAGSLVLLLMWVNYTSLILLFGAAFTRAYLEADDRTIVPRRMAVRVHRQLVEDDVGAS